MLAIAGQTAEPNGLTFFQRPMGIPGVTKASKIQFFLNYTPATWASITYYEIILYNSTLTFASHEKLEEGELASLFNNAEVNFFSIFWQKLVKGTVDVDIYTLKGLLT